VNENSLTIQSINQSVFIVATDTVRTTENHTGERQGKEKFHRWSLRFCLNTVNDEAEVTCSGSVFQMRAPATGKAREPMEVSRTAGTISSSVVQEFITTPKESGKWNIVGCTQVHIGGVEVNWILYFTFLPTIGEKRVQITLIVYFCVLLLTYIHRHVTVVFGV